MHGYFLLPLLLAFGLLPCSLPATEEIRTEFSFFAAAVVQGGRGRSTNPGATFSQIDVGIAHSLRPGLDLEIALPYSQANREMGITLFMMRSELFRREKRSLELLFGPCDVPLGLDYAIIRR